MEWHVEHELKNTGRNGRGKDSVNPLPLAAVNPTRLESITPSLVGLEFTFLVEEEVHNEQINCVSTAQPSQACAARVAWLICADTR